MKSQRIIVWIHEKRQFLARGRSWREVPRRAAMCNTSESITGSRNLFRRHQGSIHTWNCIEETTPSSSLNPHPSPCLWITLLSLLLIPESPLSLVNPMFIVSLAFFSYSDSIYNWDSLMKETYAWLHLSHTSRKSIYSFSFENQSKNGYAYTFT